MKTSKGPLFRFLCALLMVAAAPAPAGPPRAIRHTPARCASLAHSAALSRFPGRKIFKEAGTVPARPPERARSGHPVAGSAALPNPYPTLLNAHLRPEMDRAGLEAKFTSEGSEELSEQWLRELLPKERWEAGQSRSRTSGYPQELQKVRGETWSDAPAVMTPDAVVVQGRSVMESWQREYMAQFAKVVTRGGGRILELGFGMGLSADAIQKHDIKEHVIVEPNREIYEMAVKFSKTAPHKVTVIHGRWQDVITDEMLLPNGSFDGIFFDASPFDERELHFRQFDFAEHAQRLLKPGGIYTYCNLTSLGRVKDFYDSWDDLFRETQFPRLREHGFEDSSFEVVAVDPPKGHPKYQHKEAIVPILRKNLLSTEPDRAGLEKKLTPAAGLEQLERQLRVESLPANAGLENQEDVLWEGPYSDLQKTIEASLPDWRDKWNERGIVTSRFVVVFPEQIAEEGTRGILRLLDRKTVTARGKPERIARAMIRALEGIFEPSELADITFQIVRSPRNAFVEIRPLVAKADQEGFISYKRWIQRDQEDVEFSGITTTDRLFRALSRDEVVHITSQQLKDFQFLHLINESRQGDYLLLFPFNSQGVMIAPISAGTVSFPLSQLDLQGESFPLFFPRVIVPHLEGSDQSLEGFLNEVTVHGIHFQTNPQEDIFIQSAGEGNIYLEVFEQAGLEGGFKPFPEAQLRQFLDQGRSIPIPVTGPFIARLASSLESDSEEVRKMATLIAGWLPHGLRTVVETTRAAIWAQSKYRVPIRVVSHTGPNGKEVLSKVSGRHLLGAIEAIYAEPEQRYRKLWVVHGRKFNGFSQRGDILSVIRSPEPKTAPLAIRGSRHYTLYQTRELGEKGQLEEKSSSLLVQAASGTDIGELKIRHFHGLDEVIPLIDDIRGADDLRGERVSTSQYVRQALKLQPGQRVLVVTLPDDGSGFSGKLFTHLDLLDRFATKMSWLFREGKIRPLPYPDPLNPVEELRRYATEAKATSKEILEQAHVSWQDLVVLHLKHVPPGSEREWIPADAQVAVLNITDEEAIALSDFELGILQAVALNLPTHMLVISKMEYKEFLGERVLVLYL